MLQCSESVHNPLLGTIPARNVPWPGLGIDVVNLLLSYTYISRHSYVSESDTSSLPYIYKTTIWGPILYNVRVRMQLSPE